MTPIGGVRSGIVGSGVAIPDSVVSRDADDDSASENEYFGLRISTSVEWSAIGGTISQNTSGVTRARVIRVSDSQVLGTTDVSSLSAGDSFTVDLSDNLVSGEQYDFVLDAEGSNYTVGFFSGDNSPYTSSDGNLTIDTGVRETTESVTMNAIVTVGNVGF